MDGVNLPCWLLRDRAALESANKCFLCHLSKERCNGFEVGVGPSVVVVVVDEALATQMTSKTMTDNIYAFIFDQHGAMAGLGIQGNEIATIDKQDHSTESTALNR